MNNQRVSFADLQNKVLPYKNMDVRYTNKYFGSMLTFGIGHEISVSNYRNKTCISNALLISVYNVYWELCDLNKEIILNSDLIVDTAQFQKILGNNKFIGIKKATDTLEICFEYGLHLLIDLTNTYQSDDSIVRFSFDGIDDIFVSPIACFYQT